MNIEAQLDAVTLEVVKKSKIKGGGLNKEQVRSSVARYLGIDNSAMPIATHEIVAVVEVMLDVIGVTTILTASIRMHNQSLAWSFIFDCHIECTTY